MPANARRTRLFELLLIAGLLTAVLLLAVFNKLPARLNPTYNIDAPSGFSMTVLALDKADCILLRNAETAVLIDGGENSDAGTVVGFLLAQKVTTLDLVVATHPHADHIGGLDDVLNEEDITAKRVLTYDLPDELLPDTAAVRNFEQAVRDSGAQICDNAPGSVIALDGITLTVLGPLGEYGDVNGYSLVLRADCGGVSVLLCGDAPAEAESDLLRDPATAAKLDCDIMKVAHHGSVSSTEKDFIAAVSPAYAVITGRMGSDEAAGYQKVTARLQAAGATVYNTAVNGRVTLYAAEDGSLSVRTEKE